VSDPVTDAEIVATRPAPAVPTGMTRVEGRYVTAVAVQKPRSLPAVLRALETEATLSGESFYYGWAAGKERDRGPVRQAGPGGGPLLGQLRRRDCCPCRRRHRRLGLHRRVRGPRDRLHHLARQFRQSKSWKVHGKHDEDRKRDIRFQIGQSKAVRNVILNAIPSGLIDRALEVARDGARAKLQGFIDKVDREKGKGQGTVQAVDLVLKGLAKHGAREEAVLRKLEVAERKAIDIDRLLTLRGDLAALDAGECRCEELYPPAKTEQLAERLAATRPEEKKPEEKPAKDGKLFGEPPNIDAQKR
jgi:hypothetical protein